ncbi:hypothetical protein C5C02_11720 [Rathayibacter rathayi]|nr:hypothetical protein C5C02_11720 [Rathayibacter rathayi]
MERLHGAAAEGAVAAPKAELGTVAPSSAGAVTVATARAVLTADRDRRLQMALVIGCSVKARPATLCA